MLTLNQGDNMSNEQTILFVICYSIAIILIYKFINFKTKTKNMELIDATCTDTTLKTTYQKNIRIYYYTYIYKNEEYKTADKTKFLMPGFNPKIKKVFKIFPVPVWIGGWRPRSLRPGRTGSFRRGRLGFF